MAIVTSYTIADKHLQKDSRVWLSHYFIDAAGVKYRADTLVDSGITQAAIDIIRSGIESNLVDRLASDEVNMLLVGY